MSYGVGVEEPLQLGGFLLQLAVQLRHLVQDVFDLMLLENGLQIVGVAFRLEQSAEELGGQDGHLFVELYFILYFVLLGQVLVVDQIDELLNAVVHDLLEPLLFGHDLYLPSEKRYSCFSLGGCSAGIDC